MLEVAENHPFSHDEGRVVGPGFHKQVYELVKTVPSGWVTTYGDIAGRLGSRSVARHVGFALAALTEGHDVPWWRVVAATGRLSQAPDAASQQAEHLRSEGLAIKNLRVCDFKKRRYVF